MNVTESRDISPDNDKNSMLNILSAKTEILTALHDVPPLVRSLDVVKRKMPRCKGLPDEPFPLKKNDATVIIGKGDLMLCPSCDTERRRRDCEAEAQ